MYQQRYSGKVIFILASDVISIILHHQNHRHLKTLHILHLIKKTYIEGT